MWGQPPPLGARPGSVGVAFQRTGFRGKFLPASSSKHQRLTKPCNRLIVFNMARFTTANAREMAAKAHAARLQRLTSGNLAAATLPQTPQVGPHEAANAYVITRLARVRGQLDLVDKRITEQANKPKVDGQSLNWLCSAQERLAEQERVLANRPLPGSRRPPVERNFGRQRTQEAGPLGLACGVGPLPG